MPNTIKEVKQELKFWLGKKTELYLVLFQTLKERDKWAAESSSPSSMHHKDTVPSGPISLPLIYHNHKFTSELYSESVTKEKAKKIS